MMSRIHTLIAEPEAAARFFRAEASEDLAFPSYVIEGTHGPVVFQSGRGRKLRLMKWGFPRLTQAMRSRGEAAQPLGLVADLTNPMWEDLVQDPKYRCLIPISHFANPDGPEGKRTRTWFSVKGQPIIAWAGFCRNTEAFGPAFAGMTMEANAAIPPTNDRMPVLLEPNEHEQWLTGSIQDVIRFQFREPILGERMIVDRTDARWQSEGLPSKTEP
jgi:putative SOS response-associated peptidase YedK